MKPKDTATLPHFLMGAITMRPFAGDQLMAVRAELPWDPQRRFMLIHTSR